MEVTFKMIHRNGHSIDTRRSYVYPNNVGPANPGFDQDGQIRVSSFY